MSKNWKEPNIEQVKVVLASAANWRQAAQTCGYIDTRKFKNFCRRAGLTVVFNSSKNLIDDVVRVTPNIGSHRLKCRLISAGLKTATCEKCSLSEWNGKPIPIELHHRDGNSKNNALDNLLILCPNCHAQEPNNKGRAAKGKRHMGGKLTQEKVTNAIENSYDMKGAFKLLGIESWGRRYEVLGALKKRLGLKFKARDAKINSVGRILSASAAQSKETVVKQTAQTRPTKEVLEKRIWEGPAYQLSKEFNVSATTLRVWCQKLGVVRPPIGYWQRIFSGMTPKLALLPVTKNTVKRKVMPVLVPIRAVELRKKGETWRKIERILGYNRTSIKYRMRKLGLPIV